MSSVVFKTKKNRIGGTSYGEVYGKAMQTYARVARQTKRRTYVKSRYFKRQKVFLNLFWIHLRQKNPRERFRRLKYFDAALDLIQKTRCHPVSRDNPHKSQEILHRFAGLTRENELFYVQIKERKRTGEKYFMSCFPDT